MSYVGFIRVGILAVFCLLFLFGNVNLVLSDQVWVGSNTNFGQGFLRGRQKICYVIVPRHVVADAPLVQVFTLDRLSSNAVPNTIYPADLAILRLVRSNIPCPEFRPPEFKVATILRNKTSGAVVTVGEDGSLRRRQVQIVSYDERYIRVRPMHPDDSLYRGLSGSGLEIEGGVIGMLMQVESDSGIGLILRHDFLSEIVERFFRAPPPSRVDENVPVIDSEASKAFPVDCEQQVKEILDDIEEFVCLRVLSNSIFEISQECVDPSYNAAVTRIELKEGREIVGERAQVTGLKNHDTFCIRVVESQYNNEFVSNRYLIIQEWDRSVEIKNFN